MVTIYVFANTFTIQVADFDDLIKDYNSKEDTSKNKRQCHSTSNSPKREKRQ